MNSFSGDFISRWPELPPDVLLSIAGDVDPVIGILRLRSVCRSWRSSLSLSSSTSSPHFPLKLPFPLSPPPSSPTHLSLLQRTVYFLSLPADPSAGFLVKVEELSANTFSLFDPLSKLKPCKPESPINLLNYGVSTICHLYVVEDLDARVSELGQIVIKKVVVTEGFFEKGDFVVLGLTESGQLLLWRFGDEIWTEIGTNGRQFDDIISYKGKFYATADKRGRLVMIDSRLKPIDMVHSLMYGCGNSTHLVESDGDLYLVDKVSYYNGLGIGVFKLDEKCRFWDYELSLNDNVFFVGNDVNFSVSKKDYIGGDVRNCIYFITKDDEGSRDFTSMFDMKSGTIYPMLDSKQWGAPYWPPSSWFSDWAVDYSSS